MGIHRIAAELGLTRVERAGGGLEFSVWRAVHPEHGVVAVRVAIDEIASNANDPRVVMADVLRQEAALYDDLGGRGLPVPRAISFRTSPVAHLICEYVEHDDQGFGSYDLGAILARLHAQAAPGFGLVADEAGSFAATIAARLSRRWQVVRRLDDTLPPLPEPQALAELLTADRDRSLLHLDVRASNVLGANGRIRALVDWSNSLVGDPAFELARVGENARLAGNGLAMDDLLAGYASAGEVPRRAEAQWRVYQLDAIAMLAIVFAHEAPDRDLAARMVERARRVSALL